MILDKLSFLFYFLLIIGIYLVFSDSFAQSMEQRKAKAKVEKELKKKDKKESSEKLKKVQTYLQNMIAVVKGRRNKEDIYRFYQVSVLLCVCLFLLAYVIMTPKVAPLAAILGLVLPLAYYRSKLQEIRNAASKEGEALATEILNNYKIYHYNMLEAVRNSAESLSENAPLSKRMLIELSYEFNTVSSKEEIVQAVERFKFGINTTWASMLATNIELAQIEGIRVTAAMEDLVKSIIKARKAMEETKRQGSEGIKMLKFLVPGLYLFTILSASMAFGMSFQEFFHNQFKTSMGSTWFLIVCISYIGSILIANFISKDKMDI